MTDFASRETISTQSIRPIASVITDSISVTDSTGIGIVDKHIRPSIASRVDGIARLNALLAHTTLKVMVNVNGIRFSVKSVLPGRTEDTIHCALSECEASIEVKSTVPLMLYVDSPQSFRGSLT